MKHRELHLEFIELPSKGLKGKRVDNSQEETVLMDQNYFTDIISSAPPAKKIEYREVCEYDSEGVYLRTYKSAREAAKFLHVGQDTVRKCCKGEIRKAFSIDRIFLYRGDDIEDRMALIEQLESESKYKYPENIEEYTIKGVYLRSFSSSTQAGKVCNIPARDIGRCCRGRSLLYIGDRIFLFKGEDIKDRLKKVRDFKRKEEFQGKLGRLVNMYDLNGKVLELYPSLSKAAEDNNVSIWTVFNCCKGHKDGQPRLSVGDKIFLYDGDSIKLRLKEIDNLKKK